MKKYTGYLKDVEGSVIKGGKHVPYKDAAGYWTIGYGTRISKAELGSFGKEATYKGKTIWSGGKTFNESEAESELQTKASVSLDQAERYATNRGFDWGKISDMQKHGLADFMYNLGPTKMDSGQFIDTMGAYLSGENVVSNEDPNLSHKRGYYVNGKRFELKDRNKKWKELFGGSQKEGEWIMGSMLKLDNPLEIV
jgi:GH24 family phage-related lysozyme (muramidase)